jgi:hypothetical protein
MTNYTRFSTDDPHIWQLVDLDAPADSPVLFVNGDDAQADEVAAALNTTATATPPLVYILCPDGEPPDIRGVYSVQGAATAPAPTAIANRILDAVEEQGLAAWTLLSDDDSATCRAELAAAITAILKDGTP